jgi:hypothetical protein
MADEQIIEQVADKIEDVASGVEEVAEATRRLTLTNLGFFVVGAGIGVAVGFTVGYRIADKRLKTKYEGLAIHEISRMREHYFQKEKAAQPKPPINEVIKERHEERYTEAELKAIAETNERFPAEEEEEVVVEETTQQVNVFESDSEDEWDYRFEISQRTQGVPYIIHIDEFRENPLNHDQTTYTYYEIDDTLSDSRDTTVDDMDRVIGLGNLGRWGHGSQDPNVVYIRNEEIGLDVEVVRDRGSYSETVNKTIRHSADTKQHPRRKRRFDDDDESTR